MATCTAFWCEIDFEVVVEQRRMKKCCFENWAKIKQYYKINAGRQQKQDERYSQRQLKVWFLSFICWRKSMHFMVKECNGLCSCLLHVWMRMVSSWIYGQHAIQTEDNFAKQCFLASFCFCFILLPIGLFLFISFDRISQASSWIRFKCSQFFRLLI